MNDIWSIFVISMVGLVIFGGVGTINDYMFEKGMLSDESNILYLQYNAQWLGLDSESELMFDSLYADGVNQGELDPDVNALESFVKEYGEAKARVGILRNSMRLITNLPAMVFISLPFVDAEDVNYYLGILFIIIIVMVTIAVYKALFQRKVD